MTSQGVYLQVPLYKCPERSEYHAMFGYNQSMPGPAVIVERLFDSEFARVDADMFATMEENHGHGHQGQDVYTRNNVANCDWLETRIHRTYAYPGSILLNQRTPSIRP